MNGLTTTASAAPLRSNNFTLARFVLAAMVILQHSYHAVDGNSSRDPVHRAFGSLTGGDMAVDLFFLLSGYLISESWLRRPELRAYFAARVLRIYPGFIVALLVSVVVAGVLGAESPAAFFGAVSWPRFLGGSFLLAMLGLPDAYVTPNGAQYSVNVALWSVGFEFRMYILTPILAWLGLIQRPRGAVLLAVATSLVWAFAPIPERLPSALNFIVISPEGFLRSCTFFFWGAAFRASWDRLPKHAALAVLSTLAIVLLLHAPWARRLLLAPLGGYAFMWLGTRPALRVSRWLDERDITYGAYLYGWPVQGALWWNMRSISPLSLFAWSLAGASILALLSWRLIERPALRWKERVAGPRARSKPGVAGKSSS